MLPDLTVLLALLLGLFALVPEPVDAWPAGLGTLAAVLVGAALTWMAGERGVRAVEERRPRDFEAAARWVDVWPLAAWAAAIWLFGWGQLVAVQVPRAAWLGRYVVLFAPAAVLFAVGWSQRGRIQAALATARGAELAQPGAGGAIRQAVKRNGLALFPMLVLIGLFDGIWLLGQLGVPGFRPLARWMEVMPLLNLGVMVAVLTLLVLGLPAIFRRILSTEPLPAGPGREVLERQAQVLGLRYRDILVWKTRGLTLNAMVMGFTPRTRLIFLTDALLRYLPQEEVLAVFSHEAGHAKKHHLPLFLVLFVSSAVLFLLVGEFLGQHGVDPFLVNIAHLAFVWFVLFGSVSRLFEREADAYGADHAARLDPGAESVAVSGLDSPLPAGAALMVRALERIRRLSGKSASHRHGTIEERVSFVAARATRPGIRQQFSSVLRRLKIVIAGGVVLAGIGVAWRLPAEVALARTWVRFDEAGVAADEALAERRAGRERAAEPKWRASLAGFEDVAARIEGDSAPSEKTLRFWALFNAADVAFHGLGDEAKGLAGFEAVIAYARASQLPAPETRWLRFQARIDGGRILAHRSDPAAFAARQKAKELYAALRTQGDRSPGSRGYQKDRLALLDAVLLARGEAAAAALAVADPLGYVAAARRGLRLGGRSARERLAALAEREGSGVEWDELRRDARLELSLLPGGA